MRESEESERGAREDGHSKLTRSKSLPPASHYQATRTSDPIGSQDGELARITILKTHLSSARKLSSVLKRSLTTYLTPNNSTTQQKPKKIREYSSAQKNEQKVEGFKEGKRSVLQDTKGYWDNQSDVNIDSGYAWIILVVIFFISASTYGTARAYSLIFERQARDGSANSRTSAALPFTLMGALENMAGPLSGYLLSHRNNSWRLMVLAGCSLITLAHLLASFSVNSQLGQILSMGVMCGLGTSFVTISFFQINNAYFVRYRSTAFGIGLTGAAFGTFYISPLCQYALDHGGIDTCYLMLALILLPNVPLSLLLKPKKTKRRPLTISNSCTLYYLNGREFGYKQGEIETLSRKVSLNNERSGGIGVRASIKQILKNPMFYLIWPTQLLFCWFNFVFGMIVVDFGRDRGMDEANLARLLPIWALGQLVGRLVLGPFVDLNYFTYKIWTVISFVSMSLCMLGMNSIDLKDFQANDAAGWEMATLLAGSMHFLIFLLSMLIALLYLLFNGLIVIYVEKQLQPFCIGISSFVGSFLLLPRASVIGYYRDSVGSYSSMISLFTWISAGAALLWLVCPLVARKFAHFWEQRLRLPVVLITPEKRLKVEQKRSDEP